MEDNPFWNSVEVKSSDECWEWKSTLTPQGYGMVGEWSQDAELSHRVAWRLVNGPIPKFIGSRKTLIRHLCHNKSCVNPKHLALGNYSDNANDAKRVGKGMKLSKDEFLEIRKLRSLGMTYLQIQKELNLGRGTVWRACKGKGIYLEWSRDIP